jgi:hypothetical protein
MYRLFCFFLFSCSFCFSQEAENNIPRGGMIGVSFGRIPQTDIATTGGTYESRWGGINAALPVYRSFNPLADERSFQQISLTGSLHRNTTDFSLLAEPRVITSGWLGGSWFYIGEAKNFYMVSGNIGFAEDKLIVGSAAVRLHLTALGSYHLSNPVLLMYGAAYSALFGRDLLMPLVGLRWRMGDDWSGAVMIPLSFMMRYKANDILSFQFALSAAGDHMRVANRNDFAGYSSTLQMRMTGIKIAIRSAVRLSDAIGLYVEIGSIAGRTVSILSGSTVVSKNRVDTSRFFSLGIGYRFSRDDSAPSDED